MTHLIVPLWHWGIAFVCLNIFVQNNFAGWERLRKNRNYKNGSKCDRLYWGIILVSGFVFQGLALIRLLCPVCSQGELDSMPLYLSMSSTAPLYHWRVPGTIGSNLLSAALGPVSTKHITQTSFKTLKSVRTKQSKRSPSSHLMTVHVGSTTHKNVSVGWRPSLFGWRPSLLGWRPSLLDASWILLTAPPKKNSNIPAEALGMTPPAPAWLCDCQAHQRTRDSFFASKERATHSVFVYIDLDILLVVMSMFSLRFSFIACLPLLGRATRTTRVTQPLALIGGSSGLRPDANVSEAAFKWTVIFLLYFFIMISGMMTKSGNWARNLHEKQGKKRVESQCESESLKLWVSRRRGGWVRKPQKKWSAPPPSPPSFLLHWRNTEEVKS